MFKWVRQCDVRMGTDRRYLNMCSCGTLECMMLRHERELTGNVEQTHKCSEQTEAQTLNTQIMESRDEKLTTRPPHRMCDVGIYTAM